MLNFIPADIGRLFRTLVKDLRAIMQIIGLLIHYWTAGRKMRKEYQACQARGETYWLDGQDAESDADNVR